MNNDIAPIKTSPAPYYVVVKDEADKALCMLEETMVNEKPVNLNLLKTSAELELLNPALKETNPQVGNIYIFNDFTEKYIKADTNDAFLKDSIARCEKFLQFCRMIGVQSVSYVSEESNKNKQATSMKAELDVDVEGKGGGKIDVSHDNSSAASFQKAINYSYKTEGVEDCDDDEVKRWYDQERLGRFSEFRQVYEHWQASTSGGELKIKLNYLLEMSGNRSAAVELGVKVNKVCEVNATYQQKDDFESIESSTKEIYVKFFPRKNKKKVKNIPHEALVLPPELSVPEEKPTSYFWIWIAAAAAVVIAGAVFLLLKFC